MKKQFNLENFIYLAVILSPLYLVKIKIFSVSINIWEIIFFLIFMFWIAKRWKNLDLGKFYKKYKKYVISAGLFFFGLIISLFYNYLHNYLPNYLHSWGIIISWFLVPIIFMLISADIIPAEKKENIFKAYYLSAFFSALISLGYLFFGQLTYDGRLQGFFNSPNYLAMYLAPAIIIAIIQNSKFKNKFLIVSFLVILVVFYMTYSYAAWASLIVSFWIVLLIKHNISLKKIVLTLSIIILLVFSQIKNNKFTDLMGSNPRSSLASRAMIWKSAGRMLENNLVFGIGAGNFQKTYLEYQKFYPPYLEWAVPHPHNLYLALWLYGGSVGFFGFILLIFFYFKDIFKKIKNKEEKKTKHCFVSTDKLLYISLGIMLYILVHGLADTTYFKNDLAVVFWLCLLPIFRD